MDAAGEGTVTIEDVTILGEDRVVAQVKPESMDISIRRPLPLTHGLKRGSSESSRFSITAMGQMIGWFIILPPVLGISTHSTCGALDG